MSEINSFKPEEVIFAPTSQCNLTCSHCTVKRSTKKMSTKYATRFLRDCKKNEIEWVGFSGGEPFLMPSFLECVSEVAVESEMFFDRLMTNAVWFKNKAQLKDILQGLYNSGFDGTFGVSVDAFHKQDIKKVAMFIRTVFSIWEKQDCVQLVKVVGYNDKESDNKIATLFGFLGRKLEIAEIELSPVDGVAKAKEPWDAKEWFEDDFCSGPGNVFYVHPDGRVAVCCGYANESDELVVGNIRNDNVVKLLKKANESSFVNAVYKTGLATIRKRLEQNGYKFPGKTKNHCFFCWYILNKIPTETLNSVL